jgi:hypothetical protein
MEANQVAVEDDGAIDIAHRKHYNFESPVHHALLFSEASPYHFDVARTSLVACVLPHCRPEFESERLACPEACLYLLVADPAHQRDSVGPANGLVEEWFDVQDEHRES